jgi:hypothetical protein
MAGLGKMRVGQRVEKGSGPSGSPDDEANIGGVASGEITDSDLSASIERHIEETARRQVMLKMALVAGWVGSIIFVTLIILLLRG